MNQNVVTLTHRTENVPLKVAQNQGFTCPKVGQGSVKDVLKIELIHQSEGEGSFDPG